MVKMSRYLVAWSCEVHNNKANAPAACPASGVLLQVVQCLYYIPKVQFFSFANFMTGSIGIKMSACIVITIFLFPL